VYQFKPK